MTACNQIVFSTPARIVNEQSSSVITARFRDRATDADVTPTNVQYRIDDLRMCIPIVDWTVVTPGTEVSITVTSDQNKIQDGTRNLERKQLIVAADYGLSTQFIERFTYEVR